MHAANAPRQRDEAYRGPDRSARQRFLDARNFVVFYGYGHAEEVQRFDIAILEPAAWDGDSVLRLKDAGLVVLAYLSLLEPQPGEALDGFGPSDFLSERAAEACGHQQLIVDPGSPRCIERAQAKVTNAMRLHFDGLFIDTVSDVERPVLTRFDGSVAPADQLALAVVHAIASIRQAWPSAILCQNMGLETICRLSVGSVDGFCWENFNRCPQNRWFWKTLEWLAGLGPEKRVFLLAEGGDCTVTDSQRDIEMASRGQSLGFLTYLAPRGYSSGVNLIEALTKGTR
ncbi:MAG: hypothetical protein Q8P50_17910 [Bacillota bacterium]|nr:hypothetical protein [Bacillota bacterium]